MPDGLTTASSAQPEAAPRDQRPVTDDDPSQADELSWEQVRDKARSLRVIAAEITDEEFNWQDARFGRDSRYGRETLFLVADSAWILATSEGIDISRADAIDTTIKIEIDVSRITHEAFHGTEGKIWLPLLVMPANQISSGRAAGQQPDTHTATDDPDPFVSLIVSDAAGSLLPTVPAVDVRHWVSAAMAEIIVNMATALWDGPRDKRPVPTRDQRLVMAAAIYRQFSGGAGPLVSGRPTDQASPFSSNHRAAGRLAKAKDELTSLLRRYTEVDTDQHGKQQEGGGKKGPERPSGAALTVRAVQILEAFTNAVVVVVPVDREQSPTVLTVRLPPRPLEGTKPWFLAPQRAELSIDLLLPSADADRQVRIALPDGVSLDSSSGQNPTEMTIEVDRPQPLKDVVDLMACLNQPDQQKLPPGGLQSVADLTAVKARGVAETLRQHLLCSPPSDSTDWDDATQQAYDELINLSAECDRLADAEPESGQAEEIIQAVIRPMGTRTWLAKPLRRRTSAEAQGPRSVLGRAALIENISQRPTPLSGKIKIRVEVSDAEYFLIARFAGVMSIVLMTVVLAFLWIAAKWHGPHGTPSPEVLAGALTLFSAIQAGRIDHPDRSTLRGRLSASGNWRIVLSILPTIVLAVLLAFYNSGWTPFWAALAAIGVQFAIQVIRFPALRRRQRLGTAPPPDYAQLGVLRSSWWRSTTADALKLGRKAQGYVVWEHDGPPNLMRLLGQATQAAPTPAPSSSPGAARRLLTRLGPLLAAEPGAASGISDGTAGLPSERPANILALLRGSTAAQALTFVVFREQPESGWAGEGADVFPVRFDPDRLAPTENASDAVEIFLSVPCPGDWPALAHHPIPAVLEAAADERLVVLETNLPVPPPVASRPDRAWARVRVGLRDGEIRRLPGFLRALHQRIALNRWMLPSDVLIRTTAGSDLRLLARTEDSGLLGDGNGTSDRPVSARDLDVVSQVTRRAGSGQPLPPQGEWRVLAFYADTQARIDADILGSLGRRWPGLRLAGLDHAVLHGLTVMLMLAHEPDGRSGRAELDALTEQYADAHATFLVDEWQTAEELGQASDEPVLRVNIRGPDQPGMVLDALESLYTALTSAMADEASPISELDGELPPGTESAGRGVWHAFVRVTAMTTIRLAIRLTGATEKVWHWDQAKLDEIQRETRQLAVNAAQRRRAASLTGDRLGIAEDTVISVGLLREVTVLDGTEPESARNQHGSRSSVS